MVDPLSYFTFQLVLHDWYVLSCLSDDAHVAAAGFLSRNLSGPLSYV